MHDRGNNLDSEGGCISAISNVYPQQPGQLCGAIYPKGAFQLPSRDSSLPGADIWEAGSSNEGPLALKLDGANRTDLTSVALVHSGPVAGFSSTCQRRSFAGFAQGTRDTQR